MATLREADARAVDLLLDRAAAVRGDGGMQFAHQAGVSNEQVAAVERVLNLLHVMPAGEPSPDLVRRTLQRIDADTGSPLHNERAPLIDAGRPVA
jgi:hypothetical protein